MRKIFLTSGLVVCMACPAFADLGPNNKVLDANEQETTTSASCQEPTLEGYSGTSTFTAKWKANNYNITYAPGDHGSGGQTLTNAATFASDYVIRDLGSDITTKSGVTANTGYHFLSWLGSSTGANPDTTYNSLTPANRTYSETATISPYSIAGDLTLTAQWKWNVSGAITLDSSVYPNNNTSSQASYTTSSGVTGATPNPLYSAYDIGLFSTQALAEEGVTDLLSSITIPAKDGYRFDGFWAGNSQMIAEDGSILNAAKTQIPTENTTATWYAHWTPSNYNIVYHPGTAKSGSASHTVSGSDKTVQATFDAAYSIIGNSGSGNDTNYSQTGYTFDGWLANYTIQDGTASALTNDNTEGGTSYSAGDSGTYKVVGNVDLYAQWKAKQYDVIYDKGAHSASNNYTDTNGITFDTTYTTLAQATTNITADAGYTFCGWSQSSSDSCTSNTLINAGSAMSAPWTTDDDLTLYAIYKADNFTITYNCGTQPGTQPLTGSVPAQQPVTQDGTYNIAANTCIYQGWHFTGWKCDYDLTQANVMPLNGVTYQPGNTGTFKSAHNVTCTAQWAANEITTTFVGNGGTVTGGGQSCTYEGTISLPSAVTRTGYTFDGWTVTNTPASN